MHTKTNIRRAGLLLAAVAAFLLTACGSPSAPAQPTAQSLEGSWSGTGEGIVMTANVANGEITINLVMRDMEGLYWAGSFPKTVSGENVAISSTGDVVKTKKSLFGSNAASKEFVYADNGLTFDFRIMGVTQPITLKKTNA